MTSKSLFTSSTYITREISRSRKGARRLPQQSNIIPAAINYEPTTFEHMNDTDDLQVDPQEHLIQYHNNTIKSHVPLLCLFFHSALLLIVPT